MKIQFMLCVAMAALLSGCASSLEPPRAQNNVCEIFDERPDWRRAAERASDRWGTPISVKMAIIWRESSFRGDARPPKTYTLFGLIPTGRLSSAYGYSQALDGTWDWYKEEAGRWGADRDDFDDAIDFVGWYMNKTRRSNGLSFGDAVSQYLAYHEGHTGYRRGSYRRKPGVIRAARQVGNMAHVYRRQISRCGGDFG